MDLSSVQTVTVRSRTKSREQRLSAGIGETERGHSELSSAIMRDIRRHGITDMTPAA